MALDPTRLDPSTLAKIPPDVWRYFTAGNKVTPLFGANCLDTTDVIHGRTVDLLAGASTSIQVEMYNIDEPGMVDLLTAAAARGVRVQVVIDPPTDVTDAPRQAAIERMRGGGVDVHEYPIPNTSPPPIDHVKMLIVDGQRAILGGMNWGTHSPLNHDYDVDVQGPAVDRLEWLFAEDWALSGGDPASLPPRGIQPEVGDDTVNLVISADDPHERTLAKTVLRAIQNAQHSIHVEQFALTEYRAIQALIDAHQRGLDVRVILDPLMIGKNKTNDDTCKRLRAAGVAVKWYTCDAATVEKMHAKIGIFDGDQVIVGSANWTTSGFETNREADLEILSRPLNQAFEAQFEDDWANRTADAPVYLPSTP